jgi:phage terminase large subunit
MVLDVEIADPFKDLFRTDKRYILYYGGRGGGKSTAIAQFLLIKGLTSKYRILCTREIQESIEASVHKLLSDLIKQYGLPYTIQKRSIYSELTGTEFMFNGLRDDTSKSIKSMEGVDLCWVEEAQYVTKNSLDILTPTIRKDGSQIIFSYNRLTEMDPLHIMFPESRPDVFKQKVNSTENPFVSEVAKRDAETMKEANYDEYLHIWEGHPVQDDGWTALPLKDVRKAVDRKIEDSDKHDLIECGIDVAGGGQDNTVIYVRKGWEIIDQFITPKKVPTWEIASRAYAMAGDKCSAYCVDDTGIGEGVSDELERIVGYDKVHRVNFAEKPQDERKYPDIITELYFNFYEILHKVKIPNDPHLIRDLSSRKYNYPNTSKAKGRRQIEKKDDFKKRTGESPDRGDAFLLCYVGNKMRRSNTELWAF